MKLLIEAKADVNSNGSFGESTLTTAADRGFTDIVEMLIEAKADVDNSNNLSTVEYCCRC